MGSALDRLAEAGIGVAVGDFGTGYSPLSNLKEYPVGSLKIDRSFVSGLPSNAGVAAVVEAVVGMAEKVGLEAVGEGVETEEQLAFLRRIGCGCAQGFLLGRPMPTEDFVAFLQGARNSREPGGDAPTGRD